MNIVKKIDQYNDNCVFFCDPIKNNIMNEGAFIRIIYSNCNFTLNGIYLLITINDVYCEKYFSKYRCIFNSLNHKELIKNLKIIEENILAKYICENKTPQFKIYEQLNNGNIKVPNDIGYKGNCSLILKISGIWETQNNYGLTFKFTKAN
jgi:hypothetical protein